METVTFRYVSNGNDVIELDGSGPYFADADTIRGYEVAYDMVKNAVTRFKREAATFELPITISAQTQQDGAQLLDRLQLALDYDVRLGKPGKLVLDGFYSHAYITAFAISTEDMHGLFEITVQTSVLVPNPVWISEKTLEFNIDPGSNAVNGFDYAYDYPHDYTGGVYASELENQLSWPCAARIVVYGPASNPCVFIGDNRYEVDVDVPEGGMLIIDGLDKSKIELLDRYGRSENVFSMRIAGVPGSGTYIFEEVPPGRHVITWDGTFRLDVTLLGERSWVPCLT